MPNKKMSAAAAKAKAAKMKADAKKKAANQFDTSPKNITENIERLTPNTKASSELIFSFGRGLPLVRCITLSSSLSHHMFNTPAAPAPIEIHSNVIKDRNKLF